MSPTGPEGPRVVVVTGGGGGIGAAIAEELGRRGDLVVTVDPLVSVDGAEQLAVPEETTAGRIVAAGGDARASSISVTDREAVQGLFHDLVRDHGRLDAVVNVAGISRPTGFASGTEEDWQAVLAVHLDGYRAVLEAALPVMAAAGRGHVLGVTSGSGWRAADAGAYACAKRAVAALTWQLGRAAPPGVVVNAISPIAVTRMVTAALARTGGSVASRGTASSTGGLSLGSMPAPEDLGPLGAHLVGADFDRCRGQVIFAGGSEVAVVDPPRLLEVARTPGVASLPRLLEALSSSAWTKAEASQASGGGSNPRFGDAYGAAEQEGPEPVTGRTCGVVAERPELGEAVAEALGARGVTVAVFPSESVPRGFAGAADAVSTLVERLGSLDALVVALAGEPPTANAATAPEGWARLLADHAHVAGQLHADAAWARAAADHAVVADRPLRLVTLTDAATSGGRSRAQSSAQLARSARRATGDRVSAFAVAVEDPNAVGVSAALAAHLVAGAETEALSGAELAVGSGWVGLRSHPSPRGSIVLGGPDLPPWFDDVLTELVGGTPQVEPGDRFASSDDSGAPR